MEWAIVGGLVIGLATSGFLLFGGRLSGISGILGGLLPPTPGDIGWRLAFLIGLVSGGMALQVVAPGAFPATVSTSTARVIVAGLLVGLGTRLSNGCTSGHGVCGLGRRSPRGLAATLTFMLTGALTVFVVEHVLGGRS